MIPEKALLPLLYNPPVQYFTKFFLHQKIIVEKHSNYNRQNYLNRCIILSANGPLSLSIPVITGSSRVPLYTEAGIDYTKRWNTVHKRAIESAYRNAPFFIYYADAFLQLYEKRYEYLWVWNLDLLTTTLRMLDLEDRLNFTASWEQEPANTADYRNTMHPKPSHQRDDPYFKPVAYYQVFQHKYGFIPNLSILDLIFNTGPEAPEILKASIAWQ